ncbi:MAG: hypothetical protein U0V64_13415 [Cyclobacteriaceae bacterium]
MKWRQVQSPHFKILFPQGYESQAQRMARTLETIRLPEARTAGTAPRRMTVLLQSQSALSNGFVTLAPRRAEFFGMPSQDYNFMGTNDWLNMLATHEYRHMSQFATSNRGFNKLIYILFGQQALAGMSFVAAPQWYWEGDAVATETAFTSSGRGRIPQFGMVFRTNLLEGKTFNYNKQYLTSYRNFIPNHYVLGFHLVSWLRKKTGDAAIWGKIAQRSWSVPFIPFAFSNATRKESGLRLPALYQEMASSLRNSWSEELSKLQLTFFERITLRKNHTYTDYAYPQPQQDGSVIVLKSGIGDIEQLEWINQQGTVVNYATGPMNKSGMISATSQGRVVWNEYRYHPRFTMKTYAVVAAYDQYEKLPREVSRRSRYAGAAISPDGYRVATIETDTSYRPRLVILDYFSKKVVRSMETPDQALLSMPHWTSDGKSVVLLSTTAQGKRVLSIDTGSGSTTELIPVSQENIGYPVPFGHYLFYNSPYSGIDNIYAVDTSSGQKYQVTCSKYGAFNAAPSPDGRYLYYNDQSPDGLDVVRIPLNPSQWKPLEQVTKASFNLYEHLVAQEQHEKILDSIPAGVYPVAKYNRFKSMLNPHSWGPYTDYNLSNFFVGMTSQNILSTTQLSAGYNYDLLERAGSLTGKVSYQGILPVIDLSFTQAHRAVDEGAIEYRKVVGADTTTVTENLKFTWDEKTIETGLKIPLQLTRSRYSSGLTAATMVGITETTHFTNSIDGGGRIIPANYPQYFFRNYTDRGTLAYQHFSLEVYRLLKRSHRDINSRWGQAVFLDAFNTVGGQFQGNQFSLYGLLYFPGLARHHSLWGWWAYQYSQIDPANIKTGAGLDNYLFRNQIPLVRGQSVSRFQTFYSMSVNYTLPVWYPDLAVGPLLNVQRVRLNGFLDYGFGTSTFGTRVSSQAYTSVGGELRFDFNIMRFLPQFNAGVRYTYGLDPAANRFEVLLGGFSF